jgi:hypothetical protein
MRTAFLATTMWLAWAVMAGAAEPPQCPPAAEGEASVRAPDGWTTAAVRSSHSFERIELFAGAMGEQNKEAPASLAPDEERPSHGGLTQVCRVDDVAGGVVLVCHYRGTPATLAISLPPDVGTCTQTIGWSPKRGVVDDPKVPPTMRCTTGRPASGAPARAH